VCARALSTHRSADDRLMAVQLHNRILDCALVLAVCVDDVHIAEIPDVSHRRVAGWVTVRYAERIEMCAGGCAALHTYGACAHIHSRRQYYR
jgi:hypothetical protein